MSAAAIVAIVALALALAGAVAAIVSLALGRVSDARADAKALADERMEHSRTRLEYERSQFENAALKSRLADSERMATALQEVLADVQANPNADLPAGDVVARVRRAAAQAARDRAGAVPADQGTAMPASPPEARPDTALMPLDE